MISVTNQTTLSPATNSVRPTEPKPDQSSAEEEAKKLQSSELDPAEEQKLRELKARDREVRAHEQAHLSAAGGHAKGGASYTYERGPDQRMYAVGGEVQVDTSVVANDPVATLRKAQIIRQAALAPVNPSSQDRQVAAQATQMENEARAEISAQKEESDSSSASAASSASDRSHVEATKGNELEAPTTCPSCGGAHSSGAHDGITAYAAMQTAQGSEAIAHR